MKSSARKVCDELGKLDSKQQEELVQEIELQSYADTWEKEPETKTPQPAVPQYLGDILETQKVRRQCAITAIKGDNETQLAIKHEKKSA